MSVCACMCVCVRVRTYVCIPTYTSGVCDFETDTLSDPRLTAAACPLMTNVGAEEILLPPDRLEIETQQ